MDQTRGLFVCMTCALVGFGVVMVYSASVTSWPTEFERVYLSRQLAALGVGTVLAIVCASAPADFWRRVAPILFVIAVVLLIAVLVPGIGTRVNGARRWLRWGRFQFQPTELAKIAIPLFLCRQIERSSATGASFFRLALTFLAVVVIPAGLILVEPDLGTALFVVAIAALVVFASGWPLSHFAWAGVLAVPAAGLIAMLRPYQMRRVSGFLAAWTDWSQVPYQLDQSMVSMGAGGLFGVGLGKGWQKLSFLPEANTDFVFAVVGEELGLVGTLSLVLLWGAFYFAGLRVVAGIAEQRFASMASFALLTQMVLQAAANMAVVTALVPPKGIPLPLVSYGGSALVMSLASVGMLLSLSKPSTPAALQSG